MPRIARIVAPGYPYHVTQRGNYQQPIFVEEDDFRQYLQWLKQPGRVGIAHQKVSNVNE